MADLRRLMKERAAFKRIEHPYARYNNGGNLSCSLCSLAIKSEVLWPSHLTSKVHRSNVKKEKDAQQELEVQTATSSNGKRANEDEEMLHDGQDRQKRVRIDEAGSQEDAATSSLPPGFFDNPADAPASNDQDMPTSQETEEDPEWAAFEATLAAEDAPQASTSANGPGATASSYASATISAGEVLYGNGQEDEEAAQEGADEEEDENDEPKETEEERRDREEREELMERIETEEREQQEADERVDSLKKRLSAIRASKKAGSSSNASSNDATKANGVSDEKEPMSEARQRRNRRLRSNA